jgi:glucokinase
LRRARELGLEEPDAIAVAKSAYAKPGLARSLIDEAATELAIHVAIVANTLDPTLVVLGGGLGSAPGRYWSTFRSELPSYLFGPLARRLRVRRAELGAAAGTIGAALRAIDPS